MTLIQFKIIKFLLKSINPHAQIDSILQSAVLSLT